MICDIFSISFFLWYQCSYSETNKQTKKTGWYQNFRYNQHPYLYVDSSFCVFVSWKLTCIMTQMRQICFVSALLCHALSGMSRNIDLFSPCSVSNHRPDTKFKINVSEWRVSCRLLSQLEIRSGHDIIKLVLTVQRWNHTVWCWRIVCLLISAINHSHYSYIKHKNKNKCNVLWVREMPLFNLLFYFIIIL